MFIKNSNNSKNSDNSKNLNTQELFDERYRNNVTVVSINVLSFVLGLAVSSMAVNISDGYIESQKSFLKDLIFVSIIATILFIIINTSGKELTL